MVQLQAGTIRDNRHSLNLWVDIRDIILVVLLWEASLWLCLDLLDLCMSYSVLRKLSKKVVWLIGRNSVTAAVSYVSAIFSTVSIVEPIHLFILPVRSTVRQLGKS